MSKFKLGSTSLYKKVKKGIMKIEVILFKPIIPEWILFGIINIIFSPPVMEETFFQLNSDCAGLGGVWYLKMCLCLR